jgi:nucleotide-binding universal stress UspA family protein
VQEAHDKSVDAIVLGIGHREAYGEYSLDETARYVLRNAPCRVILWREAAPVRAGSNNGLIAART